MIRQRFIRNGKTYVFDKKIDGWRHYNSDSDKIRCKGLSVEEIL